MKNFFTKKVIIGLLAALAVSTGVVVVILSTGNANNNDDDGNDDIPANHECEYTVLYEQEPTCLEDGEIVYHCEICQDSYTEKNGEAYGHTGTGATCQQLSYCERCGETFGELGDCFVVSWETVEATCAANAYRYGECLDCGQEVKEEFENTKLEHDFTMYYDDYNATCTSNAKRVYYCSYWCGTENVEEYEDTKLGHSFTDAEIQPSVTPATCTENEKVVHYCDNCFTEEYFEENEGTALGHDEQVIAARKNSCGVIGWNEYVVCSRCDHNTYSEIDALEHNYVGDWCDNCQYYRASEGIVYEKEYSQEYGCEVAYVVSFDECTDERVVVAVSYEGAPVVGIKQGAANAKTVENNRFVPVVVDLVLPAYLDFIEGAAFYGCENLVSVTFNSSVRFESVYGADTREYSAFTNCSNFSKVYIPNEETWCNMEMNAKMNIPGFSLTSTTELINLYVNNELIEEFVVPDSVTNIGSYAFYRVNVQSVLLHDNIESVGANAFEGSNITHLVVPGSLQVIGESAFYGCHELLSLVINEGVKEIGDYAFSVNYRGASKLETVTLPSTLEVIGDYAFENCDEIITIALPSSLKTIGDSAFYDCMGLEVVYFGENIITVSEDAFYGCSEIKEVHISDLEKWCLVDFEDSSLLGSSMQSALYLNGELIVDLVIPETITEIKQYTFNSLAQLESIVIHDDVTVIGDGAFLCCYGYRKGQQYYDGVKTIVIGNSVTSIGAQAFAYCEKLQNVFIPESVQIIGKSAFTGDYLSDLPIKCEVEEKPVGWHKNWTTSTNITFGYKRVTTNSTYDYVVTDNGATLINYKGNDIEVTIPETIDGLTVYALGSAFTGNTNIKKLVIANSIVEIESSSLVNCTNLEEVVFGNNVTTIGEYAFAGCTQLNNVVLPDSLITIESYAFQNCTALKNLDMGNSVEEICHRAFYNVILDNIVIPRSVKVIDSGAFSNDEYIRYQTIYFKGTSSEWYSMEIDDESGVTWYGTTVYFYSETDPSLEDELGFYGNHWYYGTNNEIIIWGEFE